MVNQSETALALVSARREDMDSAPGLPEFQLAAIAPVPGRGQGVLIVFGFQVDGVLNPVLAVDEM